MLNNTRLRGIRFRIEYIVWIGYDSAELYVCAEVEIKRCRRTGLAQSRQKMQRVSRTVVVLYLMGTRTLRCSTEIAVACRPVWAYYVA